MGLWGISETFITRDFMQTAAEGPYPTRGQGPWIAFNARSIAS